MNECPLLKGKRIILRRPESRDIEDRLQCGRNPEIVRGYGGDTKNMVPFTREDAATWYEKASTNPLEWFIEFNGKCIGTARLTVNELDRRARYAVGIFDASKLGMGIGTEATLLVLKYAFQTLALHRVDLKVLEFNVRAIACYGKCGFIREGIEREGVLIEGHWETDVMMRILEQEYRDQAKTTWGVCITIILSSSRIAF